MTRLPQITLALVDGSVMGSGLAIPACVEMVIATKASYFCIEDLKTGLVPAIMMPHLVQKIGASDARYMLLTAANMSATEVRRLGLVQEVVDDVKGAHAYI